ncbi:MAG: hypothetical protein C4334_04530 [Pyrinomonas sp.]
MILNSPTIMTRKGHEKEAAKARNNASPYGAEHHARAEEATEKDVLVVAFPLFCLQSTFASAIFRS